MSEATNREPRLPPALELIALDQVDSTNAEARRRALSGASDGTVIWAREQRAGRGRRGRTWESGRGNLYASVILRPDVDLETASELGFAAALALIEAFGRFLPPMAEARVKWPNDVLIHDQKVAGILLESVADQQGKISALILGIGVNIQDSPSGAETPYPATSLCREGAACDTAAADVLEVIAPYFVRWVNRWMDDGFAPLRRAWLRHAKGVGEKIHVRLPNETLSGTFLDLDAHGALILRQDSGMEQRIHVGDVFFAG